MYSLDENSIISRFIFTGPSRKLTGMIYCPGGFSKPPLYVKTTKQTGAFLFIFDQLHII
jgi:hypothetical protein